MRSGQQKAVYEACPERRSPRQQVSIPGPAWARTTSAFPRVDSFVFGARADGSKHLPKAVVVGRVVAPVPAHAVPTELLEGWRAVPHDVVYARRVVRRVGPHGAVDRLDQRAARHAVVDEARQRHRADEDAATRRHVQELQTGRLQRQRTRSAAP